MNPSRPDWLGITPLHQFARQSDVENARIFLDHGADLDAHDEDIRSTPLGWAAKFGKMPMVETLLLELAEPEAESSRMTRPWATPLAWAIRGGHDQVVPS